MSLTSHTRLMNGLSKKAENRAHSVSVFYFIYNFCRPHGTLTKTANGTKTTSAMAASLIDPFWSIEEIQEMMDSGRVVKSN